jgi:DNA invertase Pin-like site-specific DNA recombinase
MKPLIALYRVSTGGQQKSGLGLEQQKYLVQQYAKSINSEIVAEYIEVESGGSKVRPVFREAQKKAKGEEGILVFATLDRITRCGSSDIQQLIDRKIEFVCADAPHDSTMVLKIKADIAEDERKKIAERTRNALAAAKRRGIKLGMDRPGHKIDYIKGSKNGGKQTKLNWQLKQTAEHFATVMPKLAKMTADDATLAEIADKLNADGHTTINGKQFKPTTIMRLRKLLLVVAL